MLVLTRKTGDTLQIGPDIFIHFLGRRGEQLRIGIDAPKDVGIKRGELPGVPTAKESRP